MSAYADEDRWKGVFDGMAPEGWADESWFRLIEGGTNFLLDSVPGGVEVVLRSIDLMTEARNKALVWQTGFVKEGAGATTSGVVVVSGLKLLQNTFSAGAAAAEVPEAAWLLHSMITAALSSPPTPTTKLTLKVTQCPGCIPPTNANLCPTNASRPLDSLAAVARAAGASEAEVVALSDSDLAELMRDELGMGVLARNRVAAEVRARQ